MKLLDRILRAGEGKKLKALQGLVPHINALEPSIQALSDDALQAKTGEFRGRLERGEDLDDLLGEAFAVMREASVRVSGQRHFDVQLMGGAALHFGWVAEMKTGEGKTLVSTLPAYLNALGGKGVHLVTVNDYLAKLAAENMGRIAGLQGTQDGAERRFAEAVRTEWDRLGDGVRPRQDGAVGGQRCIALEHLTGEGAGVERHEIGGAAGHGARWRLGGLATRTQPVRGPPQPSSGRNSMTKQEIVLS